MSAFYTPAEKSSEMRNATLGLSVRVFYVSKKIQISLCTAFSELKGAGMSKPNKL